MMDEQDLMIAFDDMFDKLEDNKDGIFDMLSTLKKYPDSASDYFIGTCEDTIKVLDEYRTYINRAIDKVKKFKSKAQSGC